MNGDFQELTTGWSRLPTRIYRAVMCEPNVVVPNFEIRFARRLASGHAIGLRRRKAALKRSHKTWRIRVTHINGSPV